jgi:hypothetical protein
VYGRQAELLGEEAAALERDSTPDDTRLRTVVSWLAISDCLTLAAIAAQVFPSLLRHCR